MDNISGPVLALPSKQYAHNWIMSVRVGPGSRRNHQMDDDTILELENLRNQIELLSSSVEFHTKNEEHWKERASYWKARAEKAESK